MENGPTIETGVTLLRVWLGVVMLSHGYHHARSIPGTTRWFGAKGFRHPKLNAIASAGGEIAIGSALVLGLATAVAAAGAVAVMVVAFWSIHRFAGFFVFKRPDEGWEYVGTLAIAATVLALIGPGRLSLDRALGLDDVLSGWTGLALVAGGVVAAGVQLAFMWRRPPPKV
ncbi:DoxX family protein [soil metagenome]